MGVRVEAPGNPVRQGTRAFLDVASLFVGGAASKGGAGAAGGRAGSGARAGAEFAGKREGYSAYTHDLSHITGKTAQSRNRAIGVVLKEDFQSLRLTARPQQPRPPQ